MKPTLAVSVVLLAFGGLNSSAQAAEIDVSKITCAQFVFYKISNPNAIAHWLNGYYHGKRNDTIIDPEASEANVKKLRIICEQTKNYDVPLMRIIEEVGK